MNLLERLEIKYPIFLAPMAGVGTAEMAAAVSNAGGLGSLGLGASTVDEAKTAILATKKLTKKPFQVNFFCHVPNEFDEAICKNWINYLEKYFKQFDAQPPSVLNKIYSSFLENDDFFNLLLDLKPKAVSFHFGIPSTEQIELLKSTGITTMVSVTQLSEAIKAKSAGIEVIIAQGIEAGGHRGTFHHSCEAGIFTKELVELLMQHINLPIVAAGGIMNGTDILNYLKTGASAAQLGTAFIQCKESAANAAYKKALFEQPITQITESISGRAARSLFNNWHEFVDFPERPKNPGYPYAYDLGKQLHNAASKKQEHGFGAFWAGGNVAKIRALDAAELMNTLIQEMKQS